MNLTKSGPVRCSVTFKKAGSANVLKKAGTLHAGLASELKDWSAAGPMKIPLLLLALSSHSAPIPGTFSSDPHTFPRHS